MSHAYISSFYHLVWGTRKRTPFLQTPIDEKVYKYIGGIVRKENSDLLAIGGMPDHVHILVSLNKNLAIPELVRKIKSNSSKFINDNDPKIRFAWQEGYGAFSVSVSMLETVKNYINNQAEHHKTGSFEEEYIALLKKHGLDFDMRYLFDH